MSKTRYLKYYRVVNKWVRMKHSLTMQDLDLILFLEDEGYFTMYKVDVFSQIIQWEKKRMYRLVKEGWIDSVSTIEDRPYHKKYKVSMKGKMMVAKMYSVLNGDSVMINSNMSPEGKTKAPYSHKAYKKVIIKMKEEFTENMRKKKSATIKKRAGK